MNDRDALHAAICANPDEDTPRLAFADFLQEQGGKENQFRAEFIRGSIRRAREELYSPAWDAAQKAFEKTDRKLGQQLAKKQVKWTQHLAGRVVSFTIERGFVDHITVYSKRFMTEAEKFFSQNPIRSVKFVSLAAARGAVPVKELLASPHLTRISKLGLDESQLTDATLQLIGAAPHLAKLRSISLSGWQRYTAKGVVRLIQELPSLTELLLPQCGRFDDSYAATLANSPAMAKLTSLNLHEHSLTPQGMISLLTSKHAANLRELRMAIGYQHEDGIATTERRFLVREGRVIAAQLGKAQFTNLRYLDITGCRIGDAGLAAVAAGGFPALRQLDIAENNISIEGLKKLANSPLGKQLVFLCVWFNPKLDSEKLMKDVSKMFPNALIRGYGQW